VRSHGRQELPVTPALRTEDALADDRRDQSARIRAGNPPLFESSLARSWLDPAQIELDAVVVGFIAVDLL